MNLTRHLAMVYIFLLILGYGFKTLLVVSVVHQAGISQMNHGDLSCVLTLILTLTPSWSRNSLRREYDFYIQAWFSLEAHFWLYQFLLYY